MRRYRNGSLLFTMLVALASFAQTPPVSAYQTATDGLAFTGTASLEMFPCPVLTVCNGSFEASVNGTVSGIDEGNPWSVVVTTGSSASTFIYNDQCPQPIGFAVGSGVFTASAGGAAIGVYGPNLGGPAGLPLPIIAIEESFAFSWTRIGATAALTLTATARVQILRPGVGPEWRTVATDRPGSGFAAFAPTNGEVPTCDEPEPLTAFVAGTNDYAY
jgi:hypothetical protein